MIFTLKNEKNTCNCLVKSLRWAKLTSKLNKIYTCIVYALIALIFRQLMPFSDNRGKQVAIVVVILGMASVPGSQNLAHQFNIMGEFENWPHEQVEYKYKLKWHWISVTVN